MNAIVAERVYTVAEFEELVRTGEIGEEDRVELIRGRIVPKMTIGDDHVACVNLLNALLMLRAYPQGLPSIQNPVRLFDSQPEPDVVLVRCTNGLPNRKKPQPEDVLLIIEVADTSYQYDRTVKLPIYAENGIAESWIIDIPNRAIDVFRDPQPDGTYASESRFTTGEIALLQLPAVKITVGEVFALEDK